MLHSISEGALVVTSVAGPNLALKALAEGAQSHRVPFFMMGDSKSPSDFSLPGCDFYDLRRQRNLPFLYAQLCRESSYTRKNIGYLAAIAAGAKFIIETDDDNLPHENFWLGRNSEVTGDLIASPGWLNAYHYFSDTPIYPRGLPLESVRPPGFIFPPRDKTRTAACPIQQGLANGNPDVDAIYRMLFPLPVDFKPNAPLILETGTWCPYNSQNTTTFREAFPLLYLPTFCSFRMTDIWRSFVAQRVAWTCNWHISFHAATVDQERNEHDLLRDFADEVSGYLNNARIATTFNALKLAPGISNLCDNMRICYQTLVKLELVHPQELDLLEAWLTDLRRLA